MSRSVAVAVAAVVALVGMVAAQCSAPSSDPLSSSSVASSCPTLAACQAAACTCAGSGSTSFPSCLTATGQSGQSCSACLTTFVNCVVKSSTQTSNVDAACTTFNARVYVGLLAAAATPSSGFNDTALRQSCGYQMCLLTNQVDSSGNTTLTSCATQSDADVAACTYANLVGFSTTTAALNTTASPTTAVPTTPAQAPSGVDVAFTMRVSGSSWATLLADSTTQTSVSNGIRSDLATLLKINVKFIAIVSLSVGSLVVNAQVYSGSGRAASALVTSLTTGTPTFTALQAVYATVSTETLVSLGVTVTATSAPTPAPPPTPATTKAPTTPSPTSTPVGAATTHIAGRWMWLTAAAVVLVWIY